MDFDINDLNDLEFDDIFDQQDVVTEQQLNLVIKPNGKDEVINSVKNNDSKSLKYQSQKPVPSPRGKTHGDFHGGIQESGIIGSRPSVATKVFSSGEKKPSFTNYQALNNPHIHHHPRHDPKLPGRELPSRPLAKKFKAPIAPILNTSQPLPINMHDKNEAADDNEDGDNDNGSDNDCNNDGDSDGGSRKSKSANWNERVAKPGSSALPGPAGLIQTLQDSGYEMDPWDPVIISILRGDGYGIGGGGGGGGGGGVRSGGGEYKYIHEDTDSSKDSGSGRKHSAQIRNRHDRRRHDKAERPQSKSTTQALTLHPLWDSSAARMSDPDFRSGPWLAAQKTKGGGIGSGSSGGGHFETLASCLQRHQKEGTKGGGIFRRTPGHLLVIIDQVNLSPCGDGFAVLKDPSGSIGASIHQNVFEAACGFRAGSCLLLHDVCVVSLAGICAVDLVDGNGMDNAVAAAAKNNNDNSDDEHLGFDLDWPKPYSPTYLCITLENIVEVYTLDDFPTPVLVDLHPVRERNNSKREDNPTFTHDINKKHNRHPQDIDAGRSSKRQSISHKHDMDNRCKEVPTGSKTSNLARLLEDGLSDDGSGRNSSYDDCQPTIRDQLCEEEERPGPSLKAVKGNCEQEQTVIRKPTNNGLAHPHYPLSPSVSLSLSLSPSSTPLLPNSVAALLHSSQAPDYGNRFEFVEAMPRNFLQIPGNGEAKKSIFAGRRKKED